MLGTYGAFANQGIYGKPTMITRFGDKNGSLLYHTVPETKYVISAESAFVTVNLLEGVTNFGS